MLLADHLRHVSHRGVIPITAAGNEISTVQEISLCAEHFATSHGYPFFSLAYRIYPQPNKPKAGCFANYKTSWFVTYEQRGFIAIDPLINHMSRQIRPLTWVQIRSEWPNSGPLFDAAEEAGMADGLSIPLRGPNGTEAVFSLVSDKVFSPDEILDIGAKATYFGIHLLDRLVEILALSAKDKPAGNLTDRQREALALVAQGLSFREVSSRLRISEDSAKELFASAKARLGVQSREEAILGAFLSGQIYARDTVDGFAIMPSLAKVKQVLPLDSSAVGNPAGR